MALRVQRFATSFSFHAIRILFCAILCCTTFIIFWVRILLMTFDFRVSIIGIIYRYMVIVEITCSNIIAFYILFHPLAPNHPYYPIYPVHPFNPIHPIHHSHLYYPSHPFYPLVIISILSIMFIYFILSIIVIFTILAI